MISFDSTVPCFNDSTIHATKALYVCRTTESADRCSGDRVRRKSEIFVAIGACAARIRLKTNCTGFVSIGITFN
jgi:hypothetical protein